MKKILIGAALLFSYCIQAQTTLKLPWNSYAADVPNYAFQLAETSKIATDYKAAKGDVITIHMVGTSDYNMTGFQVNLVDTRATATPKPYFSQLATFQDFGTGAVTAGTQFDFTVTLAVSVDAAGAGSTYQNLVFGAKSQTATEAAGATPGKANITLTLSTYTVTFETGGAGIINLTPVPATPGQDQAIIGDVLSTTTALKQWDQVHIVLEGKSNIDMTGFQAVMSDGTEAAAYWTVLSAFKDIDTNKIAANTPFAYAFDIPITKAPLGSGAGSQNIVLLAKASALAKLTITKFEATIIPGTVGIAETNTTITNLLRSNVINENSLMLNQVVKSANIYNMEGALVKAASCTNKINVSGLSNGFYFLQTEVGSAKFIVK